MALICFNTRYILDLFLPKEIVQEYMPADFGRKFPETRIVLDATEIKIQKPSRVKDQEWNFTNLSMVILAICGVFTCAIASICR
jgi:disulfide bond formation protein DsbB